jgi:uncharacterized membrane protein
MPGRALWQNRGRLRRFMAANARAYRLTSLDMVRGLVIVIMALDHVRDSFHAGAAQDPMGDPNIGATLFFTRWITHFCAPAFVFLAGTSAGLMTTRKTPAQVGRFLLTRGLWLLLIEWFVIATAITFAPWGIEQIGGYVLVIQQTLWAIGGSMVVLAGAQFLGRRACLALGAAVVLGHNLLDPLWPVAPQGIFDTSLPLWVSLHTQMGVIVGPFFVAFAYPLLPWIGVMLSGFGCAGLFELAPGARERALLRWGAAMTAAFVVLRAIGLYGDPNPWVMQPNGVVPTLLDFLNVSKYPPSLLFVLMTLGPAAMLAANTSRVPEPLRDVLVTYGRAPFAFYIAHFYLIHALSVLLGVVQGFPASQLMTLMVFYPQGYGLSLPAVYVVWIAVVAALYPLVRWVAAVKARRADWWLSYL